MRQLGRRPKSFSRKRTACLVVNQADQIQLVGHRRELATDALPGQKKSTVVHDRNFAIEAIRRTMNSQWTANSVLTVCLTSGGRFKVPADFKKALTSDAQALTAWEDITPLARNEWICWIESAKKAEPRSRRIEWGCSSLKDGKRRPCCWPGCAHR